MCHLTPYQDDLESKQKEQDKRSECGHEEEDVEVSADFDGTVEDVEEEKERSEGILYHAEKSIRI